jgi:RNA polymerase sigma-70 factor, ECF subfamily
MEYNKEKIIGNLFHENFHALVFKSFAIVKDYDLAKDIVQDVFVKIWQNYEHIQHVSNLKPYIFKSVQNSSFNYMRDQKVHELSKVSFASLSVEYHDEKIEEENREEIYNRIHQAVDKLPENWRKAFILSKYEKRKYQEIAETMNISIKTVEKYISKALNFIRLEMKSLLFVFLSIFFIR